MPDTGTKPRVLSNDDGWVLSTYGPPITIDQIRDNMVGPHEGSPIDTVLWSVGGREVFSYETDVGERFGQGRDTFDDDREKTLAQNLRHLIENHGGPVGVISKLCHDVGMKFFASLRMNTHYNTDESNISFGRFRRDHPQWLIGRPGEQIPEHTPLWGLRSGKDFAHPQVRDFMASIAFELLERFDIDGIELDFMRHPGVFRPEEAYANRYLLTDMVQQIRQRMDEIERQKGRALELSVRVSPTLADAVRLGMDAEAWIKEGLVNVVVVGLGFNPFEAKVAEFVETAKGTKCQVLGCFEALRPVLDTDVLRAIAARYWDAGASGIYFFNYFSMSADWKKQVVGELIDPAALGRLSKTIQIDKDRPGPPESQIGHAFRHCLAREQLPVRLEVTRAGRGALLHFDVVDDLAGAKRNGSLDKCVLRLGFGGLADGDELDLQLNGQSIAWSSCQPPSRPWTRLAYDPDWGKYPSKVVPMPVECDAVEIELECPPLRQGHNELVVRLVERRSTDSAPLVLSEVAVALTYRD